MYNYLEAMKHDISQYILDNIYMPEYRNDRECLEEKLNDELWVEDSVTGNASGSYTFNTWKAKEYVMDNMDLLKEALSEFGVEPSVVGEKLLDEEWEYFDVTIRCYLLGQAIAEVLDRYDF